MGDRPKLELEFPEPIIQRIQSLLTGKGAARTTILSKSWHSAWLTRPNLDFDDSHFNERRGDRFSGEFSKYAKKTIKRYEQSNLKIESLKLCMKSNIDCCGFGAAIANKLIVKALGKLGATRLILRLDRRFDLPFEVVFGADNLVELSVRGCKINADDGKVKKCCSRLESLSLDGVKISRDGLSKVISSCPLIEKLSLSNIKGLEEEEEEKVHFWSDDEDEYLEFPAPTPPPGRSAATATRLKCLVLCHASYKALFAGGDLLLSEFPFLTDLTLTLNLKKHGSRERGEDQHLQISNCSLERITLELDDDGMGPILVKLDVPSIHKFTFEGCDIIPKLSVVSSSTREWESHVSITPTTSSFGLLNDFLAELRQSKIHLSLQVECYEGFDYRAGDVSVIRKHELENLTIDMANVPTHNCYAVFDGLFRLCRPKLITLADYRGTRKTNIDFLCEVLEKGMLEKVQFPGQFMYGLNDLEEVNAQVFDPLDVNNVPQWRAIPLSSLRDEDNNDHVPHQLSDDEDSDDSDQLFDAPHQRRHRFWLKWKP